MAVKRRVKLFWGAVDVSYSDESPYTPAETFPMGANGLPPGIGVRRAQLVFSRLTIGTGEDAVTTKIDFQNFTNGQPDDTWTDADFVTLENLLRDWWSVLSPYATTKIVADQIRWYRVGPGVLPPNPAIRVLEVNAPGGGANSLPPQSALSLTLKTVPRKQWGRMYLPLNNSTNLDADGRIKTPIADDIANRTLTMLSAAMAADFLPVIFSARRGKAYGVEVLQVDDIPDVQRSRRYDRPNYRAVLGLPQ